MGCLQSCYSSSDCRDTDDDDDEVQVRYVSLPSVSGFPELKMRDRSWCAPQIVDICIARRGSAMYVSAIEMARHQWPDDPPSGQELEVVVAVLSANRRVIGTISLDAVSDVPDPPDDAPWMVNLVVDPDFRRSGVGARLVSWAATHWAPVWFRCVPGMLEWYRRITAVQVIERKRLSLIHI